MMIATIAGRGPIMRSLTTILLGLSLSSSVAFAQDDDDILQDILGGADRKSVV